MHTPYLLLSTLIIGFMIYRTFIDKATYQKFQTYKNTSDRQLMFKKWIIESFVLFIGFTILILMLTDHAYKNLLQETTELQKIHVFEPIASEAQDMFSGFIIALLFGIIGGSYFQYKKGVDELRTLGDIKALLPKNKQELKLTGLLSINAGIVEELFFRLALPALLFVTTGSLFIAIALSIIFFGIAHWYQGFTGVIVTMLFGGLLMAIYLLTENILIVIAIHALIDLRTLYIAPYFQIKQSDLR